MKKELNTNELEMVNGGTWEGWSQEYFKTNAEAMKKAQATIDALSKKDHLYRRFEVKANASGFYFDFYKNEGYDKTGKVVKY